MQNDNFKFIPLRGMNWGDVLKWIRQTSPDHFEFVDAISGALYSIFHGSLPDAHIDDKIVIFSWNERDRQFTLKMKACPVNRSKVDVEWLIRNQEGDVLEQDFAESACWLPANLVRDFYFHWGVANEYRLLLFQLGAAVLIVTAIFAGLVIAS